MEWDGMGEGGGTRTRGTLIGWGIGGVLEYPGVLQNIAEGETFRGVVHEQFADEVSDVGREVRWELQVDLQT